MSPDCLLMLEITAQVLESESVDGIVVADGLDDAADDGLKIDIGLWW